MKDSKIPLWPLYAADALMFVIVLSIALPSAFRGESMGAAQTSVCCLTVLAGMFLALAPYWLGYKKDIATRHEHTEEARKNFEIIFDELAALRLALADLVERIENGEEKFASAAELQKKFEGFRSLSEKKFLEYDELCESAGGEISKCGVSIKNLKASVEELGADMVVLKELFSASNEAKSDEFDAIREEIAHIKDSVAEGDRPADAELPKVPGSFSGANIPEGGLLKRAFGNAESAKASVEKFVSMSPKAAVEGGDDLEEPPFDECPAPPDNTPGDSSKNASGLVAGETGATRFSDAELDSAADSDSDSADDSGYDPADDSEADGDFFERADSPSEVESAENLKSDSGKPAAKSAESETGMLFDNLPLSRERPVKPKKGDAVITVNALIGIGNKPFIRGNDAGLSPDRGVEMDYVEIGKWRYVLPEFSGELRYSVLKNDSVPPNGESEFSISPGEKRELNLFFPLDQI